MTLWVDKVRIACLFIKTWIDYYICNYDILHKNVIDFKKYAIAICLIIIYYFDSLNGIIVHLCEEIEARSFSNEISKFIGETMS